MILGNFKRVIGAEKLRNDACQHCGESTIEVTVYSHFFVLGLPFFPTQKSFSYTCVNCKSISPIDWKANSLIYNKIDSITKSYNHPIYTYLMSGIIGIAAVVGLLKEITNDHSKIEKEVKQLNHTPPSYYRPETDSIHIDYNGKTYAFLKKNSPEIAFDSLRDTTIKRTRKNKTTNHEGAQYLFELLTKANKTQSKKPIIFEGESYNDNVIILGSIPNLEYGTKEAKQELLSRCTKVLKQKFGYQYIYLGFYDKNLNLLAIQINDKQLTSKIDMEYIEGSKLHSFFIKRMKKLN